LSRSIRAVLWDFGGVITTSPFESFARYERENALPTDFIRTLNATNNHDNALARLERSHVDFDEFCRLYEAEAEAAGHRIDASAVLACLSGDVRPEMLAALRAIRAHGLKQACLTNNFTAMERAPDNPRSSILDIFDVVIESSRVGVRKPEPAFYEMACDSLGIEPAEAVMLDDLGVNLKPAREMGMTTIKVTDPAEALRELESVLGFPVS
jgi:putative hydrolase of the HAD superfamily